MLRVLGVPGVCSRRELGEPSRIRSEWSGVAIRSVASDLPRSLPAAEPSAQPGQGASVAHPRVTDGEAAATLQGVLEGGSSPDLAKIDPEAQFREPIREPNPKGAVDRRVAVGQAGVPVGGERRGGAIRQEPRR